MSVVSRLYRGETRIDFIGNRKRWYAASAVLIVICALSFIFRGFNYSIDFKGGSEFTIQASGTSLTSDKVNTAFTDAGTAPETPPSIVGSGSTRQVVVDTHTLTPKRQAALQTAVEKSLNVKGKINVSRVGSDWGHETSINALKGLVIFLIVVSIYIALRFQWRMAVGGIVALFHDLIIAAGVYSLIGFEVSPSTIVGLLTILGFSLYDTVVVYDKVAENSKGILAGSRTTFSEAANLAVNQTLMRSINTSLIALLPVAGLLFVGAGILGVGTIKDLALILFVGIASGAYSSLFLATPVVVDLTEREPQYKALAKRVAAKRSSEAKRGVDGELAGVAAAPARGSGPAPAPKVGARPQRNSSRNTNRRK
jgi:preprotein translocase subunit SecF